MRKRVYGAVAIGGALALIITVVLVSGIVKLGGTVRCSEGGSPPGEGPLGTGKLTTIAAAQSVARFPLLIPDVRAARLANLSQTWVNKQRNVALVFAHGRVIITFAPAFYSDALKEFRRFIAQNHVTAAIGQVHGQAALVITPHTDACGTNPAWVEFKHQGTDINIYSASYGTGTLLSVADSLRQRIARLPASRSGN